MPKKFFIIACEPSGDLHGSFLMQELKKISPQCEFLGLGGPRMQESGMKLLYDMTTISALGLSDVLRQYLLYRKIFYQALDAAKKFRPDRLILIDSPAFNLRFAKKIKKKFPVIYYISPQIWAWGGRRIHTIKKTISKMLVILPFEKPLYDKAGISCEFVGHPLVDETRASAPRDMLRRKFGIEEKDMAIGLLPGSRKKEIQRILPELLKTAALLQRQLPQTKFFISKSPNVPQSVYEPLLKISAMAAPLLETDFQDLVAAMDFAFVTSGTATLQTALLGTPFFLVYKASWLTYELGKRLVKVPYLGLVNLLAGKPVVAEFIQKDLHPKTMAHEARILLENPKLLEKMKHEFQALRFQLGAGASHKAARAILENLKGTALKGCPF